MENIKTELEERGYIVIRGLLGPDESANYRAALQRLSGLGDQDYGTKHFTCPDGVTQNRQFWPLIYQERLIEVVRTLLGPTARYTQHSDLHVNYAMPPPTPGRSAAGIAIPRVAISMSATIGTNRWGPTG